MSKVLNATYLFEGQNRDLRNSESFWTSLFANLIVYLSNTGARQSIPTVKFEVNENKWNFTASAPLDISGISFNNILVEANLGSLSSSNDTKGLRPDITIMNENRLVLIENKTIGSEIGMAMDLYPKLAQEVSKKLKSSYEVCFLLSIGHEKKRDWDKLKNRNDVKIILWEDVLEILDDNSLPFRTLFNFDLAQYYTRVPRNGFFKLSQV